MNEPMPNSYLDRLSDNDKKILSEIDDDIIRVYFNN